MSAVTQPRMNDREVVRCECAFLLDRKERYRKAAGLPLSIKSTSGQRNSVPEAVYAEATRSKGVTEHPTL